MPSRVAPRLPLIAWIEGRSRTQRAIGLALVACYAVWKTLQSGARTLLDRWWLDSVTEAPVWSRRTAAQLELGIGAAIAVIVLLGGSVWVVLRAGQMQTERRHRLVERYHQRVGPAHRWALIALVVVLTWRIGRAATGQWQPWLLFRHGDDVGTTVPEVGGDLGFYLFRLPFLLTASSFLRQLLAFSLAISIFGHVMSGALRLPRSDTPSTSSAVGHVTGLAALLLGAQAVHEVVIARAATATNRVGAFDGPGYVEMNVTRPMLMLAGLAAAAAGFAFVQAGRTRHWRLTLGVVAVAAVIHVGGLWVAPAVVERYVVAPAEAARQLWSIDHNLAATRAAYGIDDVGVDERPLHEGLTTGPPTDSLRVPLFDPDTLPATLQVLAGTPGTRVANVDPEQYLVDGEMRPVYTAARRASRSDLPERGWVQEHLVYTHGDGVVALAADVTDVDGRPDLSPLAGLDDAAHAPLYYGEGLDGWYAITGTRRTEVGGTEYSGSGVGLGSMSRRLVLALATGESQPVLSSELTSDSLLLYRRSLTERISAVAPFLQLDRDPYAVIDGEHVTWVVSAYTTSSTYPYAQFAPSGTAFDSKNYVHPAVLATVDATDGAVHLYRTDTDDPIIDAWADVFPDLFDPVDQLDPAVAEHVRYPDDLFALQTSLLGRYHVDDTELLFSGADRWTVSPAAATSVGVAATGQASPVDLFLTGDGFEATRTYGPGSASNPAATRDELAGIAVADHAVDGRLTLVVPGDDTLLSPQVAQSAIDADPQLAQDITLLNANGSQVQFGPMSLVIVGDDVVWVRPIIVVGTTAAAAPRLYGVAAVSNGLVGVADTVAEALQRVTQAAAE